MCSYVDQWHTITPGSIISSWSVHRGCFMTAWCQRVILDILGQKRRGMHTPQIHKTYKSEAALLKIKKKQVSPVHIRENYPFGKLKFTSCSPFSAHTRRWSIWNPPAQQKHITESQLWQFSVLKECWLWRLFHYKSNFIIFAADHKQNQLHFCVQEC